MVHVQQVEDSCLRNRNREDKMAKSFKGSSSKSTHDVQDKPKFKKRFLNQFHSNFYKNRNGRGSSLNCKEGRNVDPQKERPTCGKCGKKHVDECLVRTNSFYGCGKSCHIMKDCPNVRSQGKCSSQAQPSVLILNFQKGTVSMHLRLGVNKKALPTS